MLLLEICYCLYTSYIYVCVFINILIYIFKYLKIDNLFSKMPSILSSTCMFIHIQFCPLYIRMDPVLWTKLWASD